MSCLYELTGEASGCRPSSAPLVEESTLHSSMVDSEKPDEIVPGKKMMLIWVNGAPSTGNETTMSSRRKSFQSEMVVSGIDFDVKIFYLLT